MRRTAKVQAAGLQPGDHARIIANGANQNGLVGIVTRTAPNTVWLEYSLDGRLWNSPLRPWQLEACPAPAPKAASAAPEKPVSEAKPRQAYARPAVASAAMYRGLPGCRRVQAC